jgi:multidrug efflux system membrane fusion protein
LAEPATRRGIRKRWIFLVLILLLVALIWYRHAGPAQQAGGHGRHGGGGGPQTVGVAKAVAGSMPITLDELGTVTPISTVTVLPQISGYLTQVPFTQGEMVQAGQFLAQIDPRQYQIDLEMAQATMAKDQATLAGARSDLARYQVEARLNAIQAQQVSDEQALVAEDAAQVKIDQSNIDQYNLDLAYCHITSPITGRVGLRLVDIGNYVTSGSSTGIAVITSVAPTTVEFSVAQTDLAPVLARLGQGAVLPATAYASDDTTKLEDGTLSAVDNQVDTSTGMVKLRADFPNADQALFPNEFVNVHLLVNTLTDATLVPAPAVQEGAPGYYVYVVQPDDTVKVQKVTPGPTDGTNTVITEGVSPGDTVVTDGVDRLSDGAKVSVATPVTSAPATAAGHRHGAGGWHHHQGQTGAGGDSGGSASPSAQAPTQP